MQDHPSSSMFPSNQHDAETWKAYWKEQGQPWRTEPIIDEERQQRLLSYSQGEVDIEGGRYPFKGVRLSRADVEWLLAMPEQRRAQERTDGSKSGKQQKSLGLDVRGADLSQVNLSHLPLMRLHAGLSLEEGRHATVEQSRAAAANLAKADVSNAQLQGAQLSWATLDEAVLVEAHLQGADLGKASLKQAILAGTHLQGADLTKAHLEGSTLLEAHLEAAMLQGAYLEGANLFETHLEGARLVGAHLEGTSLLGTHFEGKALGDDERKRLRAWMAHFPEVLLAADLRGVFLNTRTHLDGLHVGNDQYGYIALAHVLQKRVLWRSGARSYGSYFFSWFLDMLAGYGYKPGRTVFAYISTILSFAIIYYALGLLAGYQPAMSPLYALIISIISFHGRSFFPGGFLPTLPMAVFAACEAIIGLTIEISFIATFTQRYFGK